MTDDVPSLPGDRGTWLQVWSETAALLGTYRDAGLESLLTEDVVRFATIQRLVALGVPVSQIEPEWRRPGVSDAVDLVVTGVCPAAVEFKFPREPKETNAAWTQHLGQALKDFYRLAFMPPEFRGRWCVQLLSRRMRRYLDSTADRFSLRLGVARAAETVLEPTVVAGLPPTARRELARWEERHAMVRASCVAAHPIGEDLLLVVHSVAPAMDTGLRPTPRASGAQC